MIVFVKDEFMTDVKTKKSSLAILTLMASITFMAILAELMPSGVLPDMANYFNISKGTAGGLIGAYAIASAFRYSVSFYNHQLESEIAT